MPGKTPAVSPTPQDGVETSAGMRGGVYCRNHTDVRFESRLNEVDRSKSGVSPILASIPGTRSAQGGGPIYNGLVRHLGDPGPMQVRFISRVSIFALSCVLGAGALSPAVGATEGVDENGFSRLAHAVLEESDNVGSLLEGGSDVDRETRVFAEALIRRGLPAEAAFVVDLGWTALFSAILVGDGDVDVPTLARLVDAGADVDRATADGLTPLVLATLLGNVAAARILIEAGADVSKVNLVQAELVRVGNADVTDVVGTDASVTPLHLAAAVGDEAMIEVLLGAGAKVDTRVGAGITPLIRAARGGHPQAVVLLLEHGAAPNRAAFDATTAVSEAVEEGHRDVLRVLLSRGANAEPRNRDGETPLMRAVEKNDTGAAELLIDHGAEVTQPLHSGDYLLHMAAWRGHTSVAELLIDRGADIDQRSTDGETALDVAISEDRMGVAALLEREGVRKP